MKTYELNATSIYIERIAFYHCAQVSICAGWMCWITRTFAAHINWWIIFNMIVLFVLRSFIHMAELFNESCYVKIMQEEKSKTEAILARVWESKSPQSDLLFSMFYVRTKRLTHVNLICHVVSVWTRSKAPWQCRLHNFANICICIDRVATSLITNACFRTGKAFCISLARNASEHTKINGLHWIRS